MPASQNNLQTARIVWIALLVAVGVYAIVLTLLLRSTSEPPIDVTMHRRVLLVLTLGHIVAIYWFRQRLPLEALGAARPSLNPELAYTTHVICWALSEAVALYGLVLGMIGRSFTEAQPFFLLGAALLVWQRPRAEHFRT